MSFLILRLWLVMKIEELMTKSVITLPADASAYEAVKLLNKNKIGCLVVVHNREIVGILTERDLLERVLEKCRNPKETGISEIMTKHVIVGKPDMELSEATRLMFESRVKKLPIIEGNRLVGIVTLTDIARATSMDKKTMELIEKLSNMHAL
jgi:CBS domain-containing protein